MDLYRAAIEHEIRRRRKDELWYRRTHWADWPDLRKENAAILRALIEIRHKARDAERAADEHRDNAAKALARGDHYVGMPS